MLFFSRMPWLANNTAKSSASLFQSIAAAAVDKKPSGKVALDVDWLQVGGLELLGYPALSY
jgi:hypothetical protein